MYNTIILKVGEAKLTKAEFDKFQKVTQFLVLTLIQQNYRDGKSQRRTKQKHNWQNIVVNIIKVLSCIILLSMP